MTASLAAVPDVAHFRQAAPPKRESAKAEATAAKAEASAAPAASEKKD